MWYVKLERMRNAELDQYFFWAKDEIFKINILSYTYFINIMSNILLCY